MAAHKLDTVDRRSLLKTAAAGATLSMTGLAGCTEMSLGGSGDGIDEDFVSIATGGTGGVYYPLGGGIANILENELDVDANAETTGASVENCRYVGNMDNTMALALGNSVLLAVQGEGDFDEELPLMAAFGAYQNHTQIVVPADSEVETLGDVEGLRVSVGAPGSGTEVIAQELLAWYDLTYDDIDEQQLNFSETADALQDGNIDVGIWSVASPASSIEQLASQQDVRLLSFPEDDLQAIDDEFPYYEASAVEAGTYPGQDEDVAVPGVTNTMIVHEEIGEDFLYDIVEAIYTNLDQLRETHPVADQFEQTARASPIDMHPGAERYFDDAGL
ncbi:TAXI family TRAP transporter solute-binding subunit [Haloferacaceae archaeon DSL9]